MGIILFIIATILFMLLGPFSVIVSFMVLVFTGQLRRLGRYFYQMAYGIDQLGNVTCQYMFNAALITRQGYRFGVPDETVSSVLGKNYRKGTLTWCGKILERILHFLDTDHSVKAIEHDEGPKLESFKSLKCTKHDFN